ncbi:hypothetical protein FJW08_15170 [Mesorhizobium sp. B3-2-1]|uniref:DUF6932 family protein n=1 Tax=Mesorhizobium sp. B3-2-1 TaxID=2589891 RepID=UPI00112B4673|nr:hypothetical protein [Mesorhizobium sp. B3-2-1]TPI30021.1 hypothetical protein FJW08_15170 [Mesorhizobium sp. B3-2-1]
MPIPDLTQFGVFPIGRHDCTLAEKQARYTGTPQRQELWTSFQEFLISTDNQPRPASCLIDGGFTSDKAAPKDIDVVFDLTGCGDADRNNWFFVCMTQQWQRTWTSQNEKSQAPGRRRYISSV